MAQAGEPAGRRHRIHALRADAADRLAASDPGLNRFRAATQAVVSVAAIIGAEYAFVKITGALQATVPPGATAAQAASIAAGNRALLVIAILLGGLLGLLTSLGVNDTTAPRLAVSTLIVPAPILASMALGLSLGGHRTAALASFPVVLALGTLARRWGPRGVLIGVPLFIGDFIGFFLYGVVHFGHLGWIAAELALAALVSLAVRLVLFFPDPQAALRRSQRSWAARAAAVAEQAALTFSPADARDPEADRAKLRRSLVRLNEAALMIDARLAEPEAIEDGSSAQRLHERLFDAELGLTNAARFAEALGQMDLPPAERLQIDGILSALRAGHLPRASTRAAHLLAHLGATASDDLAVTGGSIDPGRRHQRILLHRFASSIVLLTGALDDWMAVGAVVGADGAGAFTPAVALTAGWLPGSEQVSARASTEAGRRWDERLALAPSVRAAIQVGVAVGLATVLGDVISGRRFYWAVIAAFVSFIGVSNNLEQVRRAALRVVGTAIGIVVGSLLAQLDGHNDAACIVVVLIAMFFGVYLIRVSYAFMVIGVTVMVSQLYEQLGEFSHSLLLLRLEETIVGAVIAALTVLVVLPLRTQRVLVVALTNQLRSTRRFLDEAVRELAAPSSDPALALLARGVDSDYQMLLATARPLRHLGEAGRWAQGIVSASTGLRHYTRDLARDVPSSAGTVGPEEAALLERAGTHMRAALDELIEGCEGGAKGTFVRSASQWSALEQRSLERLRRQVADQARPVGSARPASPVPVVGPDPTALPGVVELIMAARDLQLLDGALAALAQLSGWRVTDLDTTPDPEAQRAPVGAGQGPTGAGGAGRDGAEAWGGTTPSPPSGPDPT
jgi:uncharacterized membrane protein YgaE (UPF0421/DUF939 family)